MVCGEAHVSEIEELLAALGDLDTFDAGFEDFLQRVVVAIYGISNFQVDDAYFTTIGVDTGVRCQAASSCNTGAHTRSQVAAALGKVPVLHRLRRGVKYSVRKHGSVGRITHDIAEIPRK